LVNKIILVLKQFKHNFIIYLISEIFAVSIYNVYDKNKMKYLLYSSERNGFNIDVIGLNKLFSHISKILLFKEYLEKLLIKNNSIIVLQMRMMFFI